MKRQLTIFRHAFWAFWLAWLASVAVADELKPYKYAKVFKGAEGEAITIVPLEPRSENQFLIKFHRVEGEWDDKILLHERKVYDGKEDYALKGQNYVSVVVRRGSYSVYPKSSRKELNVYFAEQESNNVDVAGIVDEYKKQR
jgi:hypothetical protein